MAKIIRVRNITKVYPDKGRQVTALDNVSFSLEEGKSMSILGPSGSGKSTLLQILGALDSPTSGEVEINGKNITKGNDGFLSKFRNETIGFVFQFFHLQEYLSVKENIEVPMFFNSKNSKKELPKELLEKVGLTSRENHFLLIFLEVRCKE